MKKLIIPLLFTLFSFAYEKIEIVRDDGSVIIGYYDVPKEEEFSVAILIPGSQLESSLRFHQSLKHKFLDRNIAVITLEKKGIDDDGQVDNKKFILSLGLDDRIDDHILLHDQLRLGVIPGWDGKTLIVGAGDGGRIGAVLGLELEHLTALIMIASGGSWPAREEVLYSFRSEMAQEGYTPQYIHSFIYQAKEEFQQAMKYPKPDHKAFGFTYKYWESLFKLNLLATLQQLECPIFCIHGMKDDRVPVESVELLANQLTDKITFKKLKNKGREIIQDPKIYDQALSWLDHQVIQIPRNTKF